MAQISGISEKMHTVTVTGYNSGGDGVARLDDGRVVFIRNAARGDVLEVALESARSRSARAVIVRVLSPSPYRVEPDCPVYPECGGCDFRHLSYGEELDAKLRRVNDALERVGGLALRAGAILTTGQTSGYRNKAVFHSDGDSLGFYKAQTHDVAPISRCLLLKDDLNDALKALAHGGDAPCETFAGPVMAGEPLAAQCTHRQRRSLPPSITLRSGRNGLEPPLEERLDGLIFRISGFFQVNTGAALLLYNKAREYAALTKRESLIDLYCGVGALTLFVGRDAGRALGVELDNAAVEAARENARLNGFSHIDFIKADAASWDPGPGMANPDCVIVDPPRKGLSPCAVSKLLSLAPGRIVYVSCDPATLARDLRALKGYEAADICAVDMFPRTANIECCCILVRRCV